VGRRTIQSDGRALACARIARAYGALMSAALASLRMHYAARIGALIVTRRFDQQAAIAALEMERDAALAQLARVLEQEKQRALREAWNVARRPFRAAAHTLPTLRPMRPASRGMAPAYKSP
jgi:hypothetical protein